MNTGGSVWIGADPGGAGNFGVAILWEDGVSQTTAVDCADEAVAFVRERLSSAPTGVGVDAPLWWSSGRSGDRHADQWIRTRYKLTGGQVQAANSLRGAALTQGAMFIVRIREVFPLVPVTESHPKALLKALFQGSWAAFSAQFRVNLAVTTDHERDAIVAAICAREGFQGRWPNDLSVNRAAAEQDPQKYWLAPVHYYWPAA